MARQRFARHVQPEPCEACGKLTTGVEGTKLCRRCFYESGLRNEHEDGYHQDAPHPDCPYCKEEASMRPNRSKYRTNAMRVARDDLWLCDDCMIVAVNDDPSGIDSDERVDEVYAGLKRLGPHLVPDFDGETGEGEEEFSSDRCDCCHTPLAGARYRFAILEEAPGGSMRSNTSEQYWVWALGRDRKPLTTEGPWGPYSYQSARSYARISATNGTHDRAVSHGKDPSSASFEIVRVYAAGTGEHKYGVAQRIGAPMAANAGIRGLKFSHGKLDEDPVGQHVVMTYRRSKLLGTVEAVDERNGHEFLTVRFFNGEYWPVIPEASEVGVLVR